MSKSKRKFQLDKKLQIPSEGESYGVDVTCQMPTSVPVAFLLIPG
ncbi:MAG TPA: hypothetical protein PK908_06820 [Bacteroidales bacterium]|nr:hypothetical protein [Bacteroidales bacterium]